MTIPADEAMKKAADIHNGYAGNIPGDPDGLMVIEKIIRALDAAGWEVRAKGVTYGMIHAGKLAAAKTHDVVKVFEAMNAAAPKLVGVKP